MNCGTDWGTNSFNLFFAMILNTRYAPFDGEKIIANEAWYIHRLMIAIISGLQLDEDVSGGEADVIAQLLAG